MKRDRPKPSGAESVHAMVRPTIIGRREYLSFVDWPIRRIRAKIDTGAFTSALGVASYELFKTDLPRARLRLALSCKRPERIVEVEAPVVRMTVVRNSGGVREQRPVIETTVCLGSVVKRIQLTLTCRSGMRCQMLLGRQALAGDFLVDTARKYVLTS
jgi:hypothetical protein